MAWLNHSGGARGPLRSVNAAGVEPVEQRIGIGSWKGEVHDVRRPTSMDRALPAVGA